MDHGSWKVEKERVGIIICSSESQKLNYIQLYLKIVNIGV